MAMNGPHQDGICHLLPEEAIARAVHWSQAFQLCRGAVGVAKVSRGVIISN